MSQAKVAGPPWVGQLGTQSCGDVSGESGLNSIGQGISEVGVVRMSEAKVARPLWGRASPRSASRGCLRRKWPEYTRAQGIPEPRVVRMSQAKVAGKPGGRAPPRSALRESLKLKLPEHLSSGHLVTQSCEDVSGESGRTPMGQGTSEIRVVRVSQAKVV